MVGKINTVQRKLILSALKELNIHATAEQVCEHIAKEHPSVSKATVYRNLRQMAAAGIILDIGNFYGSTHYDHSTHEHYHCICKICRRITDVCGKFADVREKIENPQGFEILDCKISFIGICENCKKNISQEEDKNEGK